MLISLIAGETPADGDLLTEEATEPVEPEPADVPQPEPKSPEPGNSKYNIFSPKPTSKTGNSVYNISS
jgi:hypothetical protein